MSKVKIILILTILCSGCFVSRNEKSEVPVIFDKLVGERLYEALRGQNLTNESFFIEKAEIEIIGKEGTDRLIANIKFGKPDKDIHVRCTAIAP